MNVCAAAAVTATLLEIATENEYLLLLACLLHLHYLPRVSSTTERTRRRSS